MIDHRRRALPPTPIVFHPAITNPAIAVPVVVAPFPGPRRSLRLGIAGHAAEVVAFRGLMNERDEVDYCHNALSRAEIFSAVRPKILRADSCSHVSCRNSSLVPKRTRRA